MRQVLFVVAMIGAAFLGGAVVNGPGLHWVQARLLDYMGLQDGGEIASIDLPPTASALADRQRQGNSAAVSQSGSPSQPVQTEPQAARQVPPKRPDMNAGRPAPANASSSVPPPLPVPTAIPEPSSAPADPQTKAPIAKQGLALRKTPELPGLEQARESSRPELAASGTAGSSPTEPAPAPLDPGVGPALLASRSPSPVQPGVVDQTKPAPIFLEPAPGPSSPPASVSPALGLPPVSLTGHGTSAPGSAQDWSALRLKMQSLGVTRYTIEGEPGGRVVFSCLIPLAGRQAVSQRFEAQGDDEFHAAQTAIRRIALWQATRQSPAAVAR